MTEKYLYGLGRRKTAIAKVRLLSGKGEHTINGKVIAELPHKVSSLLSLIAMSDKYHLSAITRGGGVSSQIDAIVLGVARALVSKDPALKTTLKKAGYMTRDPREKERKKPGLKRARKAPQFSKR